jgi:hypothetical protein
MFAFGVVADKLQRTYKSSMHTVYLCCRYRCHEGISLPFKVLSVINDMGRTRMELNVQAKSTFSSKLFAQNMVCEGACGVRWQGRVIEGACGVRWQGRGCEGIDGRGQRTCIDSCMCNDCNR